MPDPLSTLPRGPHRRAFRAFVGLLQADPHLSRVVKTWVDYAGGKLDGLPDVGLLLPLVRLVPELTSWSRATITGVRDVSFDIAIEVALGGSNWDESADLWDRIEAVATSPACGRALGAVGVMDLEVITPATSINDTGGAFAVASGRFRLAMLIR